MPTELEPWLLARRARLAQAAAEAACPGIDEVDPALLDRLLLTSDFALELLAAEPSSIAAIPAMTTGATLEPAPAIEPEQAASALRQYRRRQSLRLIVRELAQVDTLEDTLAALSTLAERCLALALEVADAPLRARYGTPRAASSGEPQRLCVIGMGKLGGGELNFSSDIDLILAFPEAGCCDGAGALDNEEYFTRLGRRVIALLSEVGPEGFAYRVDLRLRPFGSAGRVALPFAAMEQYYQREGRDWERYAWVKARTVAGDLAAGQALLRQLEPFVYRRYLDYGAIDGLREMKALIDAEVARRDLADHLKLGPGGIREIEFLVQLVQLIRGGREPELRRTGLLPALDAATRLGHFDPAVSERIAAAYRFLRTSENRLQMLRDEQAHVLPTGDAARARFAAALGYAGWPGYARELARHREFVQAEFASVLGDRRQRGTSPPDEARVRAFWLSLTRPGPEAAPAIDAEAPPPWCEPLLAFAQSPAVRGASVRARERLARVLPALMVAADASARPELVVDRLLRLLTAVLGRPTYLALLDERAAARERLVALMAESSLLAERVIAHPLLLDELWDSRAGRDLPEPDELAVSLNRQLGGADADDPEAVLELLAEARQAALFRLGLMRLDRRRAADVVAQALAQIADQVLAQVLALAQRDAEAQFGRIAGASRDAGLAVLGYGSLGGSELGFQSDLDLVFVYDAELATRTTEGARVLEGSRYLVRVAQRVVHWLTTLTRAGRLYEVDVRLRPDGAKGLLVLSLDAFAEYQRERAWLWERQALLRARFVAGDAALGARFEATRRELLARPLPDGASEEIASMRERWRAELDRSDEARFDLKQGTGGLIDLEFLLQSLALRHAHAHPGLLATRRSRGLLLALGELGLLRADEVEGLDEAHEVLLGLALDCTLDSSARVAARSPGLVVQTERVRAAAERYGLARVAR